VIDFGLAVKMPESGIVYPYSPENENAIVVPIFGPPERVLNQRWRIMTIFVVNTVDSTWSYTSDVWELAFLFSVMSDRERTLPFTDLTYN